jgi:hypothetical protein
MVAPELPRPEQLQHFSNCTARDCGNSSLQQQQERLRPTSASRFQQFVRRPWGRSFSISDMQLSSAGQFSATALRAYAAAAS